MTKAQVADFEARILAIAKESRPCSVRNVYYQLVAAVAIDKTDNDYERVVHRCTVLRETGRLPYSWITDGSRNAVRTPSWKTANQFLWDCRDWYVQDPWVISDRHVQVWVESRSLAGSLENTCEALRADLYAAAGFSSLSFVWQAAQNALASGKPVLAVRYIGDYDPAGVLVPEDVRRKLGEHVGESMALDFQRIAVNPDQIRSMGLPTRPRKKTERRALHVVDTVEAEAIPAPQLRDMLRSHVRALMPEDQWDRAEGLESEQRRILDQACYAARELEFKNEWDKLGDQS